MAKRTLGLSYTEKLKAVAEKLLEILYDPSEQLRKDLKIQVEIENVMCSQEETNGIPFYDNITEIMGLFFDGNLLGCVIGSDWQIPIYVVFYHDPNGTLRAYVPTNGNLFDRACKRAFGQDIIDEGLPLDKRFTGDPTDEYAYSEWYETLKYDKAEILADMSKRFSINITQ